MDYFLFDFSGVQFHYTMSLKKNVVDAKIIVEAPKEEKAE